MARHGKEIDLSTFFARTLNCRAVNNPYCKNCENCKFYANDILLNDGTEITSYEIVCTKGSKLGKTMYSSIKNVNKYVSDCPLSDDELIRINNKERLYLKRQKAYETLERLKTKIKEKQKEIESIEEELLILKGDKE